MDWNDKNRTMMVGTGSGGDTDFAVYDLCLDINGHAAAELDVGWTETLRLYSPCEAKRRIICKWEDRIPIAEYILTANSTLAGNLGVAHPDYAFMWADTVEIVPATPTWLHAVITINYHSFAFSSTAGIIRQETITPVTEVLEFNGEQVDMPVGKAWSTKNLLLQMFRYTVKLMHVKTVPLSAIFDCQDKISSTAMTIQLGYGATATVAGENVLYEGPSEMERSISMGGAEDWTYAHNFLIKPFSHQYLIQPDTINPTNISDVFQLPTTFRRYLTADMSTLGI
jgi:hypothetical protein